MTKENKIDDAELAEITGAGEPGGPDSLDKDHVGGPSGGDGSGPGTDPVGNDNPGMQNIG